MNDIIKQLNNTIYFEKLANKPLSNQNDLITKLSAAFNYSQDNAKQFINALNYYAFYVHDIDNAQNISVDLKLLILIQIYIILLTSVEQSCPEIIAIGSVTHTKGFLSIMTLLSTFVVQDSKMVQLA